MDARTKNLTLRICQAAVIAGLLFAGQVALAGIPNVELVTVIIIVSAVVFPPAVTFSAVAVFCTCEWLLWGFGYWVISYYIYWPLLAGASLTLRLIKKPLAKNAVAVAIAVVMTAFFGVLTSLVDITMAGVPSDIFWEYLGIKYVVGIWFYVTHIVSNTVIVAVLFTPLTKAGETVERLRGN